MTHKHDIGNFHALSPEEVLEKLESSRDGLDSKAAAVRLEDAGPNRLPASQKEGLLKRFFKHFNDLLIYILLGATVITAILGHWVDTGVILAVVVINAIIGFIQEGKAEDALKGIRRMLSLKAHVLRDGEWAEMNAEELVPGDIVRLRSGDRAPADMRLLESTNLQIEESALTGESVPSQKSTEAADASAGVGDRNCMSYSGTLVVAGRGLGVVSATGISTELGRINRMIVDVETLETPLTRQMKSFGKGLSVVILGMAVLMGLAGWFFHGFGLADLFLAAIGFSVAAIPEGLPAILTITLALGVQRMARRNAITRKLNAVETLGSVTVICSDKTGTLTRNEMTVRHVVTRAGRYDVSGTGYAPEGGITLEGKEASIDNRIDFRTFIEVMSVCNDSEIRKEDGHWKLVGEPTEGSLLTLARKSGFNATDFKRIDVIPFESENKFMATLNRHPEGGLRIMLKGAPDYLLDRCQFQVREDGSTEPLDQIFWQEEINKLGKMGQRVLAAAVRDAGSEKNTLSMSDVEKDMVFAGLAGII
ncbi:MAG TPA: cation-transporting P-type ATPase, partial [Desulfobacteraceae bacterium]|nr:cation-transporting P-type ATPase [Desulfobacteraceae bacterium]